MRILEACYFGTGDVGAMYARLAQVLEHTARKHCPGWAIHVQHLPPEALAAYQAASGNASHVWNTWKLEHWRERLVRAPDGAEVLLIDGDTAILQPLDPVWELDFDVAITIRQTGRLPFNAGVVFLRASERTRRFMGLWWEANLRLLGDGEEHRKWRLKYAGMNQAALGLVLEQGGHGCHVRELPCPEWNCVEWGTFDPDRTRIMHIKSGLRRTVFRLPGGVAHQRKMGDMLKVWDRLERELGEARGG